MVDGLYRNAVARRSGRTARDHFWALSILGAGGRLWAAWWPFVATTLFVGIGWEVMARSARNPLVPNVAAILSRFFEIVGNGLAAEELGATLVRVLVGLAAAFPVAVALGIASGRSDRVRRLFDPILLLGLTIPSLVWALLCVIWFGLGLTSPVVTVVLASVPVLSLNIQQGAAAVSSDLLEMAHVYRFSHRDRLTYLWLPGIAPYLLAGWRLGLSHAWKVVVLVEMFGMPNGIGYQISYEFGSHDVAGVLAWTLVFAVALSIIEFGLLKNIERFSTRWRTVSRV
jgi:NitT/TauT family transport system permease protein